ncbi:MAG: hypothetical protein PHV05_07330 [Candidatus Riflebacteria bacterium]|nr:hypothetical protein [Candidatus Riflebacteria bacterium]
MNRALYCLRAFMIVSFLLFPLSAHSLLITNPDEIKVEGLVSFGEDGAAWLKWQNHEILVTSGYMIGKDLRVVAVRHDSVVLYRTASRQYHVLLPDTRLAAKDRTELIWTLPMPIWKLTRMVGMAYRKDYVCHHSTMAQNEVRRHVHNMESMMELVVAPHHRFYPRNGLVFVAPVHVDGTGWKHLMNRIQSYRSRTMAEYFPALENRGSLISNGKSIDHALQTIAFSTGVRIAWDKPVALPLWCALRDRPWHEIIEAIVIFNGLDVVVTREGLEIR